MTDPRTVLVTDASVPSSVVTIRSLGRAGWRVVAVDSDGRAPGLGSRHVAAGHVIPSPADDPEESVAAVARIAEAETVDLVVPVTDASIIAVSARRGRLDRFRLALPDHEALEVAWDKSRTIALATQLGIPVPRTIAVHDPTDAEEAAVELGWPVVLKPTASHRRISNGTIDTRAVRYAVDPDDLGPNGHGLDSDECPLLLQQYVSGVGVGVELLLERGRPLAAFQHRRLREVPISGGQSSLRESEAVDPELLRMASDLLGAIEWTGVAMVEFRVGEAGPVLMEINGRVWGSMALPVLAGMDFPSRWANLVVDPGVPPGPIDTDYRVGVRCRNLELELRWVASAVRQLRRPHPLGPHPTSRQIASTVVGLLDPRNNFDVQTVSDIRPGLLDARRAIGGLGRDVLDRTGSTLTRSRER